MGILLLHTTPRSPPVNTRGTRPGSPRLAGGGVTLAPTGVKSKRMTLSLHPRAHCTHTERERETDRENHVDKDEEVKRPTCFSPRLSSLPLLICLYVSYSYLPLFLTLSLHFPAHSSMILTHTNTHTLVFLHLYTSRL